MGYYSCAGDMWPRGQCEGNITFFLSHFTDSIFRRDSYGSAVASLATDGPLLAPIFCYNEGERIFHGVA